MHSADAQRLAETMSALAVNLAAEHDQQATLKAIVAAAVTTVPGAKWAGISLIAGRDITAATSTADIVADIDQMQRDLDEGPCVSAIREHHTVLSNDLASDSRWPRFAIKAAERGVQSMLSFRLFVAAADLGALNLYGSAAGVFTTDSQIVGALFAQHAAVALARFDARRSTQRRDRHSRRHRSGQGDPDAPQRHYRSASVYPPGPRLPTHPDQACGRRPLDSRGARVGAARTAQLIAVTSDFRLGDCFLAWDVRLGCLDDTVNGIGRLSWFEMVRGGG
jgi:GAF domain-containing protein